MVALNVDTDGFRRTGELVDLAGALLGTDFDDPTPVPACASDAASEAIMRNLNARQEWLLGHVRAGSEQASNAAVGMKWPQARVTAVVKVNNLLNQDVQQHVFGDILKRSVTFEVRVRK